MCTSVTKPYTTNASLIWKGNETSPQRPQICSCAIFRHQPMGNIDIYALDMRINDTKQQCSDVYVNSTDQNLRFNCSSQIVPNQLLLNKSVSHQTVFGINIQEPENTDVVWIRVEGTEQFALECPPSTVSSTMTGEVSMISSPSETVYIPVNTQTASSETTTITDHGTSSIKNTSITTAPLPSVTGTKHFSNEAQTVGDPAQNTVTLVSALVPSVLIIAGVSIVIVCLCLKRKKQRRVKEEKIKSMKNSPPQEMYYLAGGISKNVYLELQNQPADYNYTTADELAPSKVTYYTIAANGDPKHVQEGGEGDYDHIRDTSFTKAGDYDTTMSVTQKVAQRGMVSSGPDDGDVYSYNHLHGTTDVGHNNATHSSKYDTPASFQKADLETNTGSPQEDSYGYNHIGSNKHVKTMQNEYDTSASAAKALAQLNNSTMENDYDHIEEKTGAKLSASTYNTAGNVRDRPDEYSLAGNVANNNPYDFAE